MRPVIESFNKFKSFLNESFKGKDGIIYEFPFTSQEQLEKYLSASGEIEDIPKKAGFVESFENEKRISSAILEALRRYCAIEGIYPKDIIQKNSEGEYSKPFKYWASLFEKRFEGNDIWPKDIIKGSANTDLRSIYEMWFTDDNKKYTKILNYLIYKELPKKITDGLKNAGISI